MTHEQALEKAAEILFPNSEACGDSGAVFRAKISSRIEAAIAAYNAAVLVDAKGLVERLLVRANREWANCGSSTTVAVLREAAAFIAQDGVPIDIVLFCPACGRQHIDAPEPAKGWANPPHKSHLCHDCGQVWRAADVPTNGVQAATTRGAKDTYPAAPAMKEASDES